MSSKKSRKKKGPPKPRNTAGLKPPWKPGESGNPKGRPPSVTLSEAYRHKLGDKFPGKNHTWAEEIAERMAKSALNRVSAATEMADRTEGKAPQYMQLDSGRALEAPTFHVNFVSAKPPSEKLPKVVDQPVPLLITEKNTGSDNRMEGEA
jgi:hypothetical protein